MSSLAPGVLDQIGARVIAMLEALGTRGVSARARGDEAWIGARDRWVVRVVAKSSRWVCPA